MEPFEAAVLGARFLAAVIAGGAVGYFWMRDARYGTNLPDMVFLIFGAILLTPLAAFAIIEAGHFVLFGTLGLTHVYQSVAAMSTTAWIVTACLYSTVIAGACTIFFFQKD